MRSRAEELAVFEKDPKTRRLVAEMVKLEAMLDELSPDKIPHYRVNPNNPEQIKRNPAFDMYHKILSQYKEIVRVLLKAINDDGVEISPLRAYLNGLKERE